MTSGMLLALSRGGPSEVQAASVCSIPNCLSPYLFLSTAPGSGRVCVNEATLQLTTWKWKQSSGKSNVPLHHLLVREDACKDCKDDHLLIKLQILCHISKLRNSLLFHSLPPHVTHP